MVTHEFKEACTEIVEILKHVDESELEKIPYKTRVMFLKYKDIEYKPEINFKNYNLYEQNLKKKTKDILVYLYLNYWCTDEEKEEIESLLKTNYKTNQRKLREKYNPDDVFKNKKDEIDKINEKENELILVEYKESIFKRIINKIKEILIN